MVIKMEMSEKAIKYRRIVFVSKILAPVFKFLYYVFMAALVLCGIIALIVFLVNTSVENIMLPPLMTLQGDHYSLFLGNGIRIDAPYDTVSLGDIKTVIYAQLILIAAVSCMMTPVSLFISKLCRNIAASSPYNLKNARYTMYIGLCVMIGYTFVLFMRRFYNYLLVKTFVSDPEAIHLSLGFDFGGVIIGLLIFLFGYVIGYSAERHITDAVKTDVHNDIVNK